MYVRITDLDEGSRIYTFISPACMFIADNQVESTLPMKANGTDSRELHSGKTPTDERLFVLVSQPKQLETTTGVQLSSTSSQNVLETDPRDQQSSNSRSSNFNRIETEMTSSSVNETFTSESVVRSSVQAGPPFCVAAAAVNGNKANEDNAQYPVVNRPTPLHPANDVHGNEKTNQQEAVIAKDEQLSREKQILQKDACKSELPSSRDVWLQKLDDSAREQDERTKVLRSGQPLSSIDERVSRDVQNTLAYLPQTSEEYQRMAFNLDDERKKMEQWAQEQELKRQV